MEPEKETVCSAKGTIIGYTKVGSSPVQLVIVHGALNIGEQWMQMARDLVEHQAADLENSMDKHPISPGEVFPNVTNGEYLEAIHISPVMKILMILIGGMLYSGSRKS